MRAEKLSPAVAAYVQHIKGWENLIRDEVAIILEKIYKDEPLSRTELNLDVTPSEVAAIWSVKNRTDINPKYVREVKRKKRVVPSKEWGEGPSYRCLYRVRDVLPVEVGHERGRPKRQGGNEGPSDLAA